LKVNIKTWRTHQIRVHLSSIWFPIIWDKVYWNEKINEEVKEKYGLCRQALHSYELIFDLYGEEVNFKAKFKDDMKRVVGDLVVVEA
jgi:23S rRNA-/tRNA-specific pseudouridylate synthase